MANGYVHVIAELRGVGKSEGDYDADNETDHYDMIEWISQQPWCDGNVGMVGISAFGGEQFRAAAQGHPALKAIFPYDSMGGYGGMWSFREFHPGGVFQTMPYHLGMFSCVHEPCGQPGPLSPEDEAKWEWAMNNPDYMMYAHLYNILTQKGQRQRHDLLGAHRPLRLPRAPREERGELPEDQDPLRVRLGRLRLHLQDALAGGAALVHATPRTRPRSGSCSTARRTCRAALPRRCTTTSSAGTTTG